jgi:glycosyltransferase involved in cell wall biosynthesis
MKLLYYSPHPQLKIDAPTGYGTHMREMVAAWRRLGVEVRTLIAGDLGGESYGDNKGPRFAKLKPVVPPLFWESFKDFQLLRYDSGLEPQLRNAIKEFQPDILYERVAYLQNSGINAALKFGIKHVSEINAPYPEERMSFSGKSFFVKQARDNERQILAKTDLVSTVSSALKDHLASKMTDIENKILVVPNSVDPSEVVHTQADVDEIESLYKLKDKFVLGFVGSIFPYHGVDLLLEAFAEISETENISLLVVGDGAILSELKASARRANVLERCIFTGSVPHRRVYPLMELMDICCMPKSNWYGSPVKIFEYGLMKKPVIAPNVSPVRDVMTHNEDGILVEPNVQSLKEAILKLIREKTFRAKISTSWHEKVLLKYTWDNAARRIIEACT